MNREPEQINLKKIYNIVDWIDVGLVIAIIAYYSNLMSNLQHELTDITEWNYAQFLSLSIEHATLTGIALLLASLAICVVFICLTVKMRAKRQIGIVRATARIIWNGIWIPLDAYFLFMILFVRFMG